MASPNDRNLIAVFLVFAIVVGYFASIVLITFAEITDGRLAQVIGLITAIQNAFMLVVGYYFGSSSGSKAKSDVINEMSGTGTGDGSGKTKSKTEITKTITSEDPAPVETPPTAWATGTAYKIGDLVTLADAKMEKFRAISNHISSPEDEPGTGPGWTTAWERQP